MIIKRDYYFNKIKELLENNWQLLDQNKGWIKKYELKDALEKVDKLIEWHNENKSEKNRTLFAVEAHFEKLIGRALFNGSVDRIERDENGRLYIVDLKKSIVLINPVSRLIVGSQPSILVATSMFGLRC